MADLVGQTVGQYQIVERLGRGGMADVYKAFHPGLAVYRALKVIRPEFVAEASFKERFQREARAVAALRHPNIVQMHDFGMQDNFYYMVMEFIEGQDLKTHLAERGQIRPFGEIVDIIKQVASGLSYAHQRGVVHRDIKPANIMLNTEGQAILTDFGIAKMVSMEEHMTQTGMGIGTPAYMAPEQAEGQSTVGPIADIYSLGIVLYQMLTGRVPFSADTPLAVMMKVVNDPMPLPSDISPDIPDVLQGVVLKATAKDPTQRYPTAEALVDGLKRSLDARLDAVSPDLVTQVTPSSEPKPGRRMAPWLVTSAFFVVLLCLLFSVVGLWLFWPSREPSLATWQFVIDASEGMDETIGGKTKMDIAQAALAEELDILPSNVDAGLRIFGGGASGQMGCDDTALLVEPATGQNEELANALAEVTPSGEAPLTKAIVQTIGDFDPNDITQTAFIIIITAGLDMCEENAIAQLERLSSRLDFEYELHLIGLGVAEEAEQEQLRQLAEAAGGEYHDAESQEDIGRVVKDELALVVDTPAPEQDEAAETTAGEAIDLHFGDTVSGAVDSAAEQDPYTFEGAEGDQVVIRVINGGDELAPEAQVYGPDDTRLCSNWQYAGQTLELLCQLKIAGTHTTLVGGHESRGQYSLFLQRANNPANATAIEFNETVAGEVANMVERAAYIFEGSEGDQLVIRMINAGDELEPEAQIYSPDGKRLCSNWQYAGQTLEMLCRLEVAGTHNFLVGGHESSGGYSLYLRRANDPANAVVIGFDETVSGEVANAVERAAYTFEGAAGDQVVVRMINTGGDLAPEMQVYRPDGKRLCSNWQYTDQTLDLQCALETAGDHTILAGGHETNGSYSLSLQHVN